MLIIADDFTGAMDTGVQFAKSGVATLVTAKTDIDFLTLDPSVEVVAIDTDSRHDAPRVAAEKIEGLLARAKRAGIGCIYKKVDSALRGNIGAELEMVLRETGVGQLPFVPAYPQNNRLTIGGRQYIDGLPIDQSPAGHDPFSPISTAFVADIIRQQSQVEVYSLSCASDPPQGDGICIYDAASDKELEEIVRKLKSLRQINVVAGCAGFAAMLPKAMGLCRPGKEPAFFLGNTLIISGSINEKSIKQFAYMKKRGINVITLGDALTDATKPGASVETLAQKARGEIERRGIVMIETVDGYPSGVNGGQPLPGERMQVKAYISRLISAICASAEVDITFVIGGDTLSAVMDAVQADGILPIDELLPGVVVGKVSGRKDMIIISKSGGFGDEDVVEKVLELIRWKPKNVAADNGAAGRAASKENKYVNL